MKKLLPLLFLMHFSIVVTGQTVLDNNPPSLKWYQLNTPNFKILYPKGFDFQAQRMGNTLENIHDAESKSLGSKPRRVSIILQNQSSISNGFVSMLPRRSEFYTMPSQDYNFAGTNDWLDLLASHEYRHIVQYQHAMRGFNRVFYYLFGATTMAGMAQAAAPEWFWEGDAVVTETAFTPSGRGKIPAFSLAFKTNLLEGRTFNYHKQYLRSYKHYIPDEYVLGYHMVSYLRKKTNDPEIWGKVTGRSWSAPFIPLAFSNALKRETGMYVTGLYRAMAEDFKKEWQEELSKLSLTPFETINKRTSKAYTDFEYPAQLSDGSLLIRKSGIGEIETFVQLKDGKQKKLFVPGLVNESGSLSVSNDVIVWNEYAFDPRWTVRTYSRIKAYDIKAKKLHLIGDKRSRYSSAALSADQKLATIRNTSEYQSQLVVLEYPSGKILKEFATDPNDFYSMPSWSQDGSKLVVLRTNATGRTICMVDYASGTITSLFPESQENVGFPVLYGNYVLYNSPATGIDNIFALNLETRERFQITSSRYGAYNPSVSRDGKFIYYNDQSKNGLDVVRSPFAPETWTKYSGAQTTPDVYSHLVEQEGDANLFRNVPNETYPTKPYSKIKSIINPYTWGLNVESDLTQASIGIASRDLLSTTQIGAGYLFDLNERTGSWRAAVSYQGWFPIIDVTGSLAKRKINEGTWYYQQIIDSDTVTFGKDLIFEWQEKSVEAGLRIPLNLTNGKFVSRVAFSNYLGYLNVSDFKNNIGGEGRWVPFRYNSLYPFLDYIDSGDLLYNHFGITASRLLKQSHRDINSKWGQSLFLNAYNTPYGGKYSGNQLSVYAILYFPGFFKHHSIWGYQSYQYTDFPTTADEARGHYIFRNRVPAPRGLSFFRSEHFYTSSINYAMPVWYPDIAIGPLLNIQRFRANGFVDYGNATLNNASEQYVSTGVEIKADLNVIRFLPQFDLGVRFTQTLQPTKSYSVEVLIGTFNF